MKHIRHFLVAIMTVLFSATPVLSAHDGLEKIIFVVAVVLGIGALVLLGSFVSFAIIYYSFLSAMRRALTCVAPHNRLMRPAMVWLMWIPGLNLVWQFVVAIRIPNSLKSEFRDRGHDDGTNHGKSLGVAFCILNILFALSIISACNIVNPVVTDHIWGEGRIDNVRNYNFWFVFFSTAGIISGISALFAGVMFWRKIAHYTYQLGGHSNSRHLLAGSERARANRDGNSSS